MSDSPRTPQHFIQRWQNTTLGERQSYQLHFTELCELVGHDRPGADGVDSSGKIFAFEYGIKKDSGAQGFADVFYEGHFAIEYKAPGKYRDLTDAYQQLLRYREQLRNPPLLIVTDIATWEVHTNFPNTEKRVYSFTNADIAHKPSILKLLRDCFENPERLHPDRNTAQVTTDAAGVFHDIAADMRRELDASPERIAHFLTKLVFCLFAEDVSLLPTAPNSSKGIFAEIVERTYTHPSRFIQYAHQLFQAMANGGDVLLQRIPYFNGSLFDDVSVEEVSTEALGKLMRAANLNWESVEPAIFGTLFERSLDPSKRAQLGAHYTSREDILLIVEPVLMQPLRRQWQSVQQQAAPLRAQLDSAATPRQRITLTRELETLRQSMLTTLREIRVLDPACGSGNFLYVSLQLLMDLEKEVITHPLFAGMTLAMPEVHPRQMYGIEINPIAHDLATIVVWIGYIQWRQNNGYATLTHREPILEALHDNIRRMDAIMTLPTSQSSPPPFTGEAGRGAFTAEAGTGLPTEPDWPQVDVIVGNPPFLGDKKMRRELGDEYVEKLRSLYADRIPGGADLVCYWFEKARSQVENNKVKRVGLLATQSIRAGANREVLRKIKETGDIFMGWSDRKWILDGASVRVSMIGFDNSVEKNRVLNGKTVESINPDLTASIDITKASYLDENSQLCFIGTQKGGAFDLDNDVAQKILKLQNLNNLSNADVVRPWLNATEIVNNPRHKWIIYFPDHFTEEDAAQYEAPFNYVVQYVKPERLKNSDRASREYWWLHQRTRGELNSALKPINRYIVSPRVSKHRVFVWVEKNTVPDSRVVAIARDDDYFFGVLHSKLHETWSLATSSRHGVGNDPTYNAESCFETFPFPWSPGHEDTASPAYQAVAAAARQLHDERQSWLTGAENSRHRTLTNLYNALNVHRGLETIRLQPEAAAFAPRLHELHTALDHAVCAAYGWPPEILADEDEILSRLLALNLQRAT